MALPPATRTATEAPAARGADVALLALVQVVFGSLAFAGKIALPEVGPYALVAVRIGAAAVVLLAAERVLVAHRLRRRDVPVLAALSLLGVALNQLFFLVGLSLTTAVEATVLITTIPVFTLAVGLAWGRERWSHRKGLGMAIAFAGVVVLVGASALQFHSASFLGNVFVVLNAFFYSIYLVASRPVLQRLPALTLSAYTFLIAAVLVLPVGLYGLRFVRPSGLDAGGFLALAYIVLGPTVFTYFSVSFALGRVPASTVASFIYLQPLSGGLLAVLFLGEPLTTQTLAAGALIFAGVGVLAVDAQRPRRYVPAE